jgi:hypothetical protein
MLSQKVSREQASQPKNKKMNSAIETELRTLLDNVNKTLALNMSTKHGLDYDEVYEFLTVSMNEDKSPVSRGRPKKEKKTVTENHKDSTGKPDVNHIIKEIMEKDAELEELSEDDIDETETTEATSVLASSPKSSKKTEKTEKPKVEKTEKPKVEKDDEKPKVEKDDEKPKAEKAQAAEKAKTEKAEAAEKAKAEKAQAAEKAKAEKAAAKVGTAEKKPKGKGKEKEKTEDVVAAAAEDDDGEGGLNVYQFEFDGKTYLRQEFGNKIYDEESNDEIGEWDEETNKIIFNA